MRSMTKRQIAIWWTIIALILVGLLVFAYAAEARGCRHGQLRRVSMGICVSMHSKLAKPYVHPRRSLRYGRHHRRASAKLLQRVERAAKAAREPVRPQAALPPYELPSSKMGLGRPSRWLLPREAE